MGQPDPLLVSLGQFVNGFVHHIGQAAKLSQLFNARQPGVRIDTSDVGNIHQVIVNQHVLVKGRRLRQVSHQLLYGQIIIPDGQVFDLYASRGGFQKTGQHPQGGGFAGTVGPQQPQYLAFFDIKADLIDSLQILITFA